MPTCMNGEKHCLHSWIVYIQSNRIKRLQSICLVFLYPLNNDTPWWVAHHGLGTVVYPWGGGGGGGGLHVIWTSVGMLGDLSPNPFFIELRF